MIIKSKYSDNENLVFPRDIEGVIDHTKIEWVKSKEDSWMELEMKLQKTPVFKKIQRSQPINIFRYAAVAAVALLIVFGATATLYTKRVQTGLVEKTILLPDNSRVKLNINSTLSYKPLLWKYSRTTQLKGEAFFEVKNGKKFEVISEKAKTVVLGTRFTVIARDNEYLVNCEQGKVLLVETLNKNEAVIIAGEEAKLKADNRFEIIRHQNTNPIEVSLETMKLDQKKEKIDHEEKILMVSKEDITPEYEKQRESRQGKNQYREINKPEVKLEVTNNNVDNHVEEIKSMLEEIDAKQQTGNQERLTLQETHNKTEGSSTETTKNRFRNSLTKKQIEILEDNNMSRDEKQKAFIKTLSNEQKKLLREQNDDTGTGNNNNKIRIKDNINQEQKNQNKDHIQNSPNNNGGDRVKGGGGKHGPK
ncbi:MAG: FecR family protein [Paludibacteraceae bacterium]